jgi:transposase
VDCNCTPNLNELLLRIAKLETKSSLTAFRLATAEAKLIATETKLAMTEAKLIATETKLAATEIELAKARKNSSNSSKPPSSDIVKPPKTTGTGKKRRRGGQEGHPLHERPSFQPEDIDTTEIYALASCPKCGGCLRPSKVGADIVQQVELAAKLVDITEHRGLAYWCARCQTIHWAPLPPEVERGGLVGPRLTALVAYLKGACHASFSTIRKFFRDVMGFRISRGQLAKVIAKVSDSLEAAYAELLEKLAAEPHLNVDETGHPENGKDLWTWCFRAELYTVFKIDPSRGSKVLVEVLGQEFDGVLGCDYFSAYHKYMGDFGIEVQFCLAHLIRDVKFLTTHPDKATRTYGEKVLGGLRRLFRTIHRREQLCEVEFQKALERERSALTHLALSYVPARSETQNLAKRFREHGEAYFRFISTPGVSPTNNLAEQAIRFVVIDRLVTQGTRSEKGRRWCERIWTVLATCERQGRSSFEYILSSITNFFTGLPHPSLLSAGP